MASFPRRLADVDDPSSGMIEQDTRHMRVRLGKMPRLGLSVCRPVSETKLVHIQ